MTARFASITTYLVVTWVGCASAAAEPNRSTTATTAASVRTSTAGPSSHAGAEPEGRSQACGCGGECEAPPQLVRLDRGWAVLSASERGAVEAAPIEAATATAAAARWSEGRLRCGATIQISAQDLLPVDGSPRALPRPVLAPKRGVGGPGPAAHAAYADVLELASLRVPDEDLLPLEVRDAGVVPVPGGRARARWLYSPLLGAVARVVGPVLELGAPATAPLVPGRAEVSAAVGRSTALRMWIDEARARPMVSEVTFEVPGLGAWPRAIEVPDLERADRSDVGKRLAVSHGIAAGFGTASVLITIFDEPECRVLCDDTPPIGFDADYLDRFQRRAGDDIDRDRRVARGLDIGIAAVALLSTLAPSARHGVLSRWEILEDALILSEGVVIAYTTPLSLEARFARARPIAHHPELGPAASPRSRVGPPFMAYGANRSGAWLGGTLAMLISEDAPWPYTLATGLTLGGLAAASGYYEVRAGLAYPSDIPLSIISGAINGAGTFLWHRWFWSGWPGSKVGDAPLRIQGLGLVATPGGAAASASLVF